MHLPAENAAQSYFGPAGTHAGLVALLEENYPGILVPGEPFERIWIAKR